MNPMESNGQKGSPQGSSKLSPEVVALLEDVEWAIQDPDVKQKYADQVVAIYRRQINAHGDDEETVLAEAHRLTGLPKNQIPITTILGPGLLFAPRN